VRAGHWRSGWSVTVSGVLDVPAKLAARVRVYSQGHGRKTDSDDAVSIGLAALDSTGVAAVRADDTLVSLRLLCDRRDELAALRTQAVCRLHRLLAELISGGTRRGLKANCWPSCARSTRSVRCACSLPASTWMTSAR
jgi:transposase